VWEKNFLQQFCNLPWSPKMIEKIHTGKAKKKRQTDSFVDPVRLISLVPQGKYHIFVKKIFFKETIRRAYTWGF
jgi:hypothetical protein